jgi:hypothetical protein
MLELFVDKFWVIVQYILIVQATAKLGLQYWILFYKVRNPVFANS